MLQNKKYDQGWLIIIYRVPSTPSTSRVTIWKKVRELGALLLQQSVYILPNLPSTKQAVQALKEQIQHLGGECKILEIASLGDDQEKEVISGFNSNREEEYTEVIKACNELLLEIDEESKTEDFHFADLEENEKHLQRVRELFDNVVERDYFDSSFREKAAKMFDECEEKFGAFSNEVYSREGIVSDERKFSTILDIATRRRQKQLQSQTELVAKLRDLIDNLNRGTLEMGNKKVRPLSDRTALEWDYKDGKESNTLEIKVSWENASPKAKENKK